MTNKCSHCVIGNIFSKEYDHSFLEQYEKTTKERSSEGKVIIYPAKKIITMNPMLPEAEAIAVKNGVIHSLGMLKDILQSLDVKKLDYEIKEDFKNEYLYPGFIESHCHASLEALYSSLLYVGAHDRMDAKGEVIRGCKTISEVLERLQISAETTKGKFIAAWGFDPTVLEEKEATLSVKNLDNISQGKPIIVLNMSGHLAYVNTLTLTMIGYDNSSEIEGLKKDEAGNLTGELQELAALEPLLHEIVLTEEQLMEGLRGIANIAKKKGLTTISDLALGYVPNSWKAMLRVTEDDSYPVRISTYILNTVLAALGGVDVYYKAKESENSKLKIAGVKIIADGSIQGYTANMKPPYYYNKDENGMRNIEVSELNEQFQQLLRHSIPCAIHTNGDAAIEEALTICAHVLRFVPDRDTRVRLEHCQTVNETQLAKMKKYNIMANFFINHIYYWGDFHAENTLGPERIKTMNPLASAKRNNIKFSLHTDAPVTELDPLRLIQTSVTRRSISGKVYGEQECISAYDALKAITIDAAYLLNEEELKGTLEVGKFADITVLDKDILTINPEKITSAKVIATLVDGQLFMADE